jgi:hypothetical protein
MAPQQYPGYRQVRLLPIRSVREWPGFAKLALYAFALYGRFWRPKGSGEIGPNRADDELVSQISADLSGAIGSIWLFARAIVQLIVVLVVIYWFESSVG